MKDRLANRQLQNFEMAKTPSWESPNLSTHSLWKRDIDHERKKGILSRIISIMSKR